MSEPLKPCPFCGASARVISPSWEDPPYNQARCVAKSCGANQRPHDTAEAAIAAWNTRKEGSE